MGNVVSASAGKSAELEQNPIMSGIRNLHRTADEGPDPKMSVAVPTDPGTEVIYNGLLYNIVQSEGSDALLEDIHGWSASTPSNGAGSRTPTRGIIARARFSTRGSIRTGGPRYLVVSGCGSRPGLSS